MNTFTTNVIRRENTTTHLAWLILTLFLITCSTGAAATHSVSSSGRQVSRDQQRIRKAERELRDYRQSLARKSLNKESNTFSVPIGASLSINKMMQTASTIFFSDDAESGVNGWTTDTHDDTILWHLTTRDANSPTHSWWCGRESQGNYNIGTAVNQSLISPTIDLSAAVGPVSMLFTENYITERGWDFCMVDASTDGGSSWVQLRGGYGTAPSGNSHGWIISTLNLSAFAGKQINIRFLFQTGDSVANFYPGWFVDNVVVFDQSGLISGKVYFDMNQNGILDNGERGLYGWVVSVSGPVNLRMPTNINGTFYLPLPLGAYQVSEVLQSPWILTSSPAAWNDTLTSAGQNIGHNDFGNYRTGSIISGLVFNDVNKDSINDAGDVPLINWWIELTDSSDYFVDDMYTDSSGQYAFLILSSGRYKVSEFLDDGWYSTVPGGDAPAYVVDVPPVDTVMSGYNFGSFYTTQPPGSGTISGFVFNDLNQNDTLDDREPGLAGRLIRLTSGYYFLNQTATDSLGNYSFQNLSPATYTVQLINPYGWAQSLPESTYSITIGVGEQRDSVIFGSYQLPVGTLRGNVFNDLNRNGQRDTLEPGLVSWSVSANGPGNWSIHTVTDSLGNYQLNNIVVGAHTVTLSLQAKWKQTLPVSSYAVNLGDGQTIDSLNFGAYALLPGSISGTLFNDLNGNGARDPGENGLSGAEIILGGDATSSAVTDDSGRYTFGGLWSGVYKVRALMLSHWRQTLPTGLQGYTITLGDEQNFGSADFGMIYDSTFNLAFRTFLPESIAYARDNRSKLGKSVLRKPTTSEATFVLKVPTGGINGLYVKFSQAVDGATLSVTHFLPPTHDPRFTTWDFAMPGTDTLAIGDSVVLYVRCLKPRMIFIRQYSWKQGAVYPAPGTVTAFNIVGQWRLLYPMPNAINVVESIYLSGIAPPGITVGIYGPHSVYHPRATSVRKSLIDPHGVHVGPPRCLGVYANTLRPITRPVNTLPPTKGNNILFAEALALKVNIFASDFGITPFGLGDLIFQGDSTNPFNGLTVRTIAANVDMAMSGFDALNKVCLCDSVYFKTMYRTIRMIDSAFTGPFDTTSFATGLIVAPARALAGVPYLYLDTAALNAPRMVIRPSRQYAEPEQFVLQQNYPNPFNPSTTIDFFLVQPSIVTLKLYNVLGQEVATLIDRQQLEDGWNRSTVSGDGLRLASGVYFYRLAAETIVGEDNPSSQKVSIVKKMLYLK